MPEFKEFGQEIGDASLGNLTFPDDLDKSPTLIGAAWRQTSIGSTLNSEQLWERLSPGDRTPVDTEQLIQMLDRDKLWGFEDHFLSTRTMGQYTATRNDIMREIADREVFEEAGLAKSLGAGLLVGLADPINWVPIGRAITIARQGSGILAKTAQTAAVFGASAALQEPILQATQELRDWKEGVMSIGAATLLGGTIGGGIGIVTSPGFTKVATRFKDEVKAWLFEPEWNNKIVEYHRAALQTIQDEIAKQPGGRRVSGIVKEDDEIQGYVPPKKIKDLPDAADVKKMTLYHGTNKDSLTELSSVFSEIEGLLGTGVYTTDRRVIGNEYAQVRAKKGGKPTVYAVEGADLRNVINADGLLHPRVAEIIEKSVYPQFKAAIVEEAGKADSTFMSLMRRLAREVEDDSHLNSTPKSDYIDMFQTIEAELRARGYDAYTHVGGMLAGGGKKLHRVVVLLDPKGELAGVLPNGTKEYDPIPMTVSKAAPVAPLTPAQQAEKALRAAGGGRLVSPKQLERKQQAFDALDAAENRLKAFRDNTMYTTGPSEWARTVIPRFLGYFHQGFLDPSDFFLKRTASVEAKLAWQQMAEVAQLLNKNVSARSSTGEAQKTAQAATTEMDWYTGRWAVWRDAMWGGGAISAGKAKAGLGNTFYAQARRAGFAGGSEDFDKAVHYAVVRGYTDPNPGIEGAAKLYKQLIVDPARELMVKAGYPDPGDSPRFALGYARRNYDIAAVRGTDGHGTEFKALATRAFRNELMTEALNGLPAGGSLTPQQLAGITKKSRSLAREAYNNITGLNSIGDGGLTFDNLTKGSPFKERVVPISDEELLNRGWISGQITESAHLQMRQTVPQLMYATRFKTKSGKPDPGLEQSVIPRIDAEYKKMAETLGGEDADALIREGARVIGVLRNQRDSFLKGPGFRSLDGSRGARAMEQMVHNVMTYQAMRLMSNLVPASIPDIAGLSFQHGMGAQLKALTNAATKYFRDNPLTGTTGYTRAELAEEAKTFGATVEWASNAGVAAHMDLNSPYQTVNGRFTNAMNSMSRVFSWSNASMWWNDMAKGAAFRATMDRVLRTAEQGWDSLPEFERRFLANHGIDKADLNRIGAAWRSQNGPLNDGFLRFGWMSQWDDAEAARMLSNAIAKNRASTVIQPRVGDKNALAQSNPIWRAILQFQSFIFSQTLRVLTLAEQRVIADGFYGRDSLRVYAGLLQYAGLGMLSQWLMAHAWDYAKGVPDGEKSRVEKLYDNPGQWTALGLERAGITGMFGQYNMMWERAGGLGMTRAWQNVFGDEALNVEAKDRWRDKDVGQVLLGPAAAQFFDLAKVGVHGWNHAWSGEGLRRSDVKTLSETGPWQNNIFMRRHVLEPANRYLAEDYLGIAYDR